MINVDSSHTPGNYHIRHDIRTRNASVELRAAAVCETLGLGPLQSMSSSCQAVAALSWTQSQLAALAVDQVQSASCKSRGAGSRLAPSCGHHDPVPRKDSLDFTMLCQILQPHGPQATNATLDQILCFLWKLIFARNAHHQWPFKVCYRIGPLITDVCKSRLVHSNVWGSAAALLWVQRETVRLCPTLLWSQDKHQQPCGPGQPAASGPLWNRFENHLAKYHIKRALWGD